MRKIGLAYSVIVSDENLLVECCIIFNNNLLAYFLFLFWSFIEKIKPVILKYFY